MEFDPMAAAITADVGMAEKLTCFIVGIQDL